MMKKFIVFLCVAGVLTGCAVGGEKTTAPKQEAKTEEIQEKETEKTEQKTEEPKETAETAENPDEDAIPENFRELFSMEADGINYLSIEGIEVPEGTAISMVGKDSASSFWKRVKAGAEQAVADLNEALGYTGNAKVKVTYDAPAKESVSEQIDIIDQMLDKNPDALIVGYIDVNSGKTQLELAESNGVPVFAVDSSIDNALIVSETKTDNCKAAAEAAAKLCEAIGDSGEVALLVHNSETETGIEREKGFREEIEQNHPNVQIIDTTYVNQDERNAEEIVAAVMADHPDLKAYFGTNDDVTRVLAAVVSKFAPEGQTVVAAGFDASSRLVDAVKDGSLSGVMAQDAFGMGYACMVSALRTIAGLDNASVIEPGYYWITAENADDATTQALTYK